MSAVIIDGKKVAEEIKSELLQRIQKLKEKEVTAGLATVLVGNDPASKVYIASKTRMCQTLGIYSKHYHLEESTSESDLVSLVKRLNDDPQIHGILVQMPLPAQISSARILETISPNKDVDGFSPISRGRLQTNEKTFVPCTPAGILELLRRYQFSLNGKHVVVLGRSGIVGLPLSLLLVQKNEATNATVTICHSATRNLSEITKLADVLVAAIGQANFVTADIIKERAVVIDVGINRVPDSTRPKGYRLSGDVDFENVKEKVAAITPVPGGVGPMTIIKLMQNTIEAAELTLCASSSTG